MALKIVSLNSVRYQGSHIPVEPISPWNCLPKALVDSETIDASKHGLKDLYSQL